jgi:hypothetical protein
MFKRKLQEFISEEYIKQQNEYEEEYNVPEKKLKSKKYDVKNCRIIAFYAEKGIVKKKKLINL